MSNHLDPDQARHFVGPDLGPNCLQKLSADDSRRQRVNLNVLVLKHRLIKKDKLCIKINNKIHILTFDMIFFCKK